MDEKTLATELLHEVKASAKRWFIAFVIVLGLWFATIVAFVIYISLPVDEITVENDGGNTSYIGNDMNGDLTYGQDNSEEAW